MTKWNMIIDVALCENCNNCMLATKDEHVGNDFPGYAAPQPLHGHKWIDLVRKVRGTGHMVDAAHVPVTCNQCDNAPCVAAGKGAVSKRADGIVLIDPKKAKGRRDIVDSCPYGAIFWNDELQLPQKWIFEAHLLDQGWSQPRGAQACPTGAMRAVKTSDAQMDELARKEQLEVLKPELGLKPRVYYRNLHRFDKCFIGGTVVAPVGGKHELISGSQVTLHKENGASAIGHIVSDTFGDFKFDRIAPDSGAYIVEAKHPEFGTGRADAIVGADSIFVGEVILRR